MLIRNSGIEIPSDHPRFNAIIKDLTITQQKFNSTDSETFVFYENINNGILIPRYYPVNDEVEDQTCEGLDIDIDSKIELRNDTQIKAVDYLSTNNNGILKALPGIGKTICTIAMMCRRKKKTLIIVHKKDLLKQWIKEITDHTTLSIDDIGVLTTQEKKYKKELDKSVLLTTPHVIGIAVKNQKYDFLKYFKECGIGVLVCDECHAVSGAETFSKSCISVNARVTLALSATPERPGPSNKIIGYHFGEIKEFEVDVKDTIVPKILVIKSNFNINKNSYKYINYSGFFELSKYYTQSKKSEMYVSLIVYLIDKAFDEGRNTLIVGNYISPLMFLAEKCKAPRESIGMFLPTAKPKEILKVSDITNMKDAFHTKQLVFSSYKACRDGNNRPNLDCAIMTSPTNNPVQLIGRLIRQLEGKKRPICFDIVDTDPTIRKVWNRDKTEKIQSFEKGLLDRLAVYDEKNWPYNISLK
jgi:superfamily II DNA or RNA helicase